MNASLSPVKQPEILCFSDTYGIQSVNGVGRFLHDLNERCTQASLSLNLVVPGRGPEIRNVTQLRAPAFALPGYSDVSVAIPLKHHRRAIQRQIADARPTCIHVSTPGPFGLFGRAMAQKYRLPLVGICHTDFPSYARDIVDQRLSAVRSDPQCYLGMALERMPPVIANCVITLATANPTFGEDLAAIREIVKRNYGVLAGRNGSDPDIVGLLGQVAETIVEQLLRRFYENFTLVAARSETQRAELQSSLKLPGERVRCLTPGTDTDKFHPDHADRRLWQQWGVPPDAFIALYVGRATAEKNVGFLKSVLQNVLKQRTDESRDMRLVVVGKGDETQINELRQLPSVHVLERKREQRCRASMLPRTYFCFRR